MQHQKEEEAVSKSATDNEIEVPDVTAAINMSEDIVHGTASVHHSADSHSLDPYYKGHGMINVRHYLEKEQQALPERAHSQVEQRHHTNSNTRGNENIESERVVQNETNKESLTNHRNIQDERASRTQESQEQNSEILTETMVNNNIQPRTSGIALSNEQEEDDWDKRVHEGFVQVAMTEKGLGGQNISMDYGRSSQDKYLGRGSQEGFEIAETPTEGELVYARGDLDNDTEENQKIVYTGNVSEEPEEQALSEKQQSIDEQNEQIEQNYQLQGDNEDDDEEENYSEDQDQVIDNQVEQTQLKQPEEVMEEQEEENIENEENGSEKDQQSQTNINRHNESTATVEVNVKVAAEEGEERVVQPIRDTTVLDELERLVINLNHTAMSNLKIDQFVMAKRLLFKAEQNLIQVDNQCAQFQATTDSISDLEDGQFAKKAGIGPLDALKNRLMGLTYNNLGCLCKQQQDFQGALVYLKRALDYESRLEDYEEDDRNLDDNMLEMNAQDLEFEMDLRTIKCNSAGTILNICAILSKLNRHKQAHDYACEAVVKLRHSMKLTKAQVLQAQQRIGFAQDKYDQRQRTINMTSEPDEDGSSVEQDPQLEELRTELDRTEENKVELENQWVNLATTAVIAHYNAAVELEFMSSWKEALEQYEKAAQLSILAMKSQNPMTVKIKQAMGKMRMKVRNKVQLPDKLPVGSGKSKTRRQGGKGGSSYMGQTSKITSNAGNASSYQAPAGLKDWQNSVSSSQYNQKIGKLQPNKQMTTISNEFDMNRIEQSPMMANFYPNGSLDQTVNSFENSQQYAGEAQMMEYRKIGGTRTVAKTRFNEKSPISLKKIINKLEMTEKQEAAKLVQPKSKFRSQRNHGTTYPISLRPISNQDDVSATISVLRDRQHGQGTTLNQIKNNMAVNSFPPNSRNMRKSNINHRTINSAGFDNGIGMDPNFLPSLSSNLVGTKEANTGFFSVRGGTVSGARQQATSPLADRKASQGLPRKKMRGAFSKPPSTAVNTKAWGIAPSNMGNSSIDGEVLMSSKQNNRRMTSNLDDSVYERTSGLRLSPTTLQIHLSVAQERRLVEQGKRLGANLSKRENDINFFLGHIRKQTTSKGTGTETSRKQSTPSSMTHRGPMSVDLATARAQILVKTTASNLAGGAYLPHKLKKTIKQRQFVSQIKKIQHQLEKEQQIDLNLQLETAFQREMASWKFEREHQLGSKLRELEDQKVQQELVEAEEAQARAEEELNNRLMTPTDEIHNEEVQEYQQNQQVYNQTKEDHQIPSDTLSAEQAQEAEPMELDAGTSREQDEEEVGNFRVSPYVEQKNKVATIDETAAPEKSPVEIQDQEEQTESQKVPAGTSKSSQVPVSEYVSSVHNLEQDRQTDNQVQDAMSGTGQEIELDVSPYEKPSQTLEVEDVVSADTNVINNFQNYRTGSHVLMDNYQNDGRVSQAEVSEKDELYKKRFNADSALQYASTKGAIGQDKPQLADNRVGNRSHNAKSTLAVLPKFENAAGLESQGVASPTGQKEEENEIVDDLVSPPQEHQRVREKEVSGIGASSIAESQRTETVMTLKSEYAQDGGAFDSSTLHEDTIAAWKVQKSITRPRSRFDGTQDDLTDDQITVVQNGSQIGDGPIFIKKSTDFTNNTTARRAKHLGSQSSLGGTMNPRRGRRAQEARDSLIHHQNTVKRNYADNHGITRKASRQKSDVTFTTDEVRYNDSRIHVVNRKSIDPVAGADNNGKDASYDLQPGSIAQKSELARQKFPSNFSIERGSVNDNISQITENVGQKQAHGSMKIKEPHTEIRGTNQEKDEPALVIESGQTTIQNLKNVKIETSFMTPRPGLTQALIKREVGFEKATLERSSIDTEMMSKVAPGHIYHSKSTNRRPPAGPIPSKDNANSSKPKKSAQQQQHMRYMESMAKAPTTQPAKNLRLKPISNATSVKTPANEASQKPQPIPTRIHVLDANAREARSMVASPQIGQKRVKNGVSMVVQGNSSLPSQMMAKSGDNNRLNQTMPIHGDKDTEPFGEQINMLQATENSRVEYQHLDSRNADPDSAGQGGVVTEKFGTQDRVAKIAHHISKLNTTLLQFQTDNEELRKDPMLKSTHRSTASKQGLVSQKSRDTNMAMPVLAAAAAAAATSSQNQVGIEEMKVPENVRALQEKRLIAQLQSAPGRSRVRMSQQKEETLGASASEVDSVQRTEQKMGQAQERQEALLLASEEGV